MDFVLFLLFMLLRQEVAALKLLGISVPSYTLRGKSVLLKCSYDLEADKLYSISWYKDHEEFYRYVPKGEPTKHSYRVEGVEVDHRRSDNQQVTLQDASLHTGGKYKCEVSAEAPSFTSVSAESSIEVVVFPEDGPTITGEEKVYATGDVLALNCTSGRSHPTAHLKWFINGQQVKPDSETVTETDGLYSVISSLRLQLEPGHIAGDKINVRCETSVKLLPKTGAPLIDTRHTDVFVVGQATVASSSVCLLVTAFLLLRVLPVI